MVEGEQEEAESWKKGDPSGGWWGNRLGTMRSWLGAWAREAGERCKAPSYAPRLSPCHHTAAKQAVPSPVPEPPPLLMTARRCNLASLIIK